MCARYQSHLKTGVFPFRLAFYDYTFLSLSFLILLDVGRPFQNPTESRMTGGVMQIHFYHVFLFHARARGGGGVAHLRVLPWTYSCTSFINIQVKKKIGPAFWQLELLQSVDDSEHRSLRLFTKHNLDRVYVKSITLKDTSKLCSCDIFVNVVKKVVYWEYPEIL